MSLEVIIQRTKSIESTLAQLGANGKGLHEKVSSIESSLPSDLVKKIRFVASVRNKSVHDENYSVSADTLKGFVSACDEIDQQLTTKSQRSSSSSRSSSSTGKSSSKGLVEQFSEASTLGKIGIVAGAALTAFALFSGK